MNEELPQVSDVLLSTSISLVNLAGIRLTGEQRDVPQAKEAIDAARALLPMCPEDQIGPIQDALSQVQMLYVRATQSPAEPGAARPPEPDAADAEARAQARSKIWTPPGS